MTCSIPSAVQKRPCANGRSFEIASTSVFSIPAASLLNLRTEAAHTPVSMLGKMFNTTNFPLASAREKVLKSPFTSEKSGASAPFCINSPASATGVP